MSIFRKAPEKRWTGECTQMWYQGKWWDIVSREEEEVYLSRIYYGDHGVGEGLVITKNEFEFLKELDRYREYESE